MELKLISEIRTLRPTDLTTYRTRAIASSPIGQVRSRLVFDRCCRSQYFEIPTSDFVFKYILASFAEHFEEVRDIYLTTCKEANLFADDGYIFCWNLGTTHCILITEEQRQELDQALTALSGGAMLDNILENNLALLEADTEQMGIHSSFLNMLGLTANFPNPVPEPSNSLDIDESTARFSSALWFEEIQKKTVILAGVGGIGSYVAFLLARMHPGALYLYDDDRVETVNMAGQLYSSADVGKYKVDAIYNTLRNFSSYNSIFAIREKFTATTEPTGIMICGFDSMTARKTFFGRWLDYLKSKSEEERQHCLFIDGRLAAEELQVFCIRGDDTYNIQRYSCEFLFSDEEADETLCSYKQTTYMANMIGSIIVNLFTNFVANELVENLRDLPFLTQYSAESMMLKTES